MRKKRAKILITLLLLPVLLIGLFFFALRYPKVQTYLAQRLTTILSKSLKTKVSIDRVEISFFNKAELVNFYMEDHNRDTMIYAKDLSVHFKVFSLLHKQIRVSSINLTGATVKLSMDSSGNNLNIAQLFKSKREDSIQQTTGKKDAFDWDIDLSQIDLHQTHVVYNNPTALSLDVLVGGLSVSMKNFNLQKGLIDIKTVKIDGADVRMALVKKQHKSDSLPKEAFHFLPPGMKIAFDDFTMSHSHFSMSNGDTVFAKQGIDFAHLDVSDIALHAQNGKVEGDTVYNSIKSFHAKEKSGFTIENITADARITSNGITLDKLKLKTPESEINDFVSLKYNSFDSLVDFARAVRIKADFENSKLAMSDVGYFVKNLGKISHNNFYVSGEIDGRLNNLKGRGIEIRTGQSTIFKGDFYAKGGPDINTTDVTLNINRLATTADDLRKIIPGAQIPENLNSLGLIYYTGSVNGTLSDFVSKGKLVTSIGSADMDVNFSYDRGNNKAYYSGALSLNEFDVGKYLGIEDYVGKISMSANVNGGGFTPESFNILIDGNISSLVAKGYDYKNIEIKGTVLKKSFTGTLQVHDKYLDMDFNGTADLSNKIPAFDLDATVRKAQLKNLNLTKDNIEVAGDMKLNFQGIKVDDFIGSIGLSNVTISRDTLSETVKNFNIEARLLANQKKEVTLVSDFAEAELSGNFSIKELPKSLMNFARYTFIKDDNDTSLSRTPQDFSLDFRLYEPGNLPQILFPKLSQINSSRVMCDFNSVDHKLNLTATIPEVTYGNLTFRRIDVKATTSKGDIDLNASLGRLYNGDNVLLDSVALTTKTEGNNLRFDLQGADGSQSNYANLTAFATRQKGKATLTIEPGDIRLGANNWHFDEGDTIYIDGNKITTHNLIFRSSQQTVNISSYLKGDSSTSLKLTMVNTSIGDFVRTFAPQSKDISGTVNGKLVIEDVFKTPDVYGDFSIDNFTLGNEMIGNINFDSRLDSTAKKIILYSSVKSNITNLEARGYISIDPDNPGLKIDIDAPAVNLNFLNYNFFDKYVKNVRGTAIVNASVYGTLKKPLLGGTVTLVNDTVGVSYLNTVYTIKRQSTKLDEHGIDIGNMTIYDIKGTEAYGSGRINHESFKDFALDLSVTTQNPDNPAINNSCQFLNTTEKEMPNFYGVAYGTGNVSFVGPINSPVIKAYATTGRNTYCKLPINSSYETNQYGFFKFTEHGQDSIITARKQQRQFKLNGVTFSLDLDVTPDARMDLILDPVTGDVLTGYGSGHLKIQIPKNSNLGIYGTYELERGNYQFTMQGIVNRKFIMDQGGSISFNGDIYKARLNLNATYEIRTSVYDLIQDMLLSYTSSGNNSQANAAQQRISVDLLMNITGNLERPSIGFDIKVIDPDPTIKSYVDQKLVVLHNNEGELYKQAFGLLVMNRFIPSQTSAGGSLVSNSATSSINDSQTATNTVSSFVSGQLSNYISNMLEFANVRNLDVNIGYQQYSQAQLSLSPGNTLTTAPLTGSEVQVALSQRLLNNRLSINAGGNLDYGSTSVTSTNKSVIPTGDVQIEYALTPNGAWRAKVFNRDNYDYYELRNTNKTGIGVSYRQEFDKAKDLVKKKKKKQAPVVTPPPTPADSTYKFLAPIPTSAPLK